MPELTFAIPMMAVTDIDRSVTFYESIGFTTGHQDEEYAIFTQDKIEIHVWKWKDMPVAFNPNIHANGCYIRMKGITEYHAALAALGVVPESGKLQERPWGLAFTALDPDNNALHFTDDTTG